MRWRQWAANAINRGLHGAGLHILASTPTDRILETIGLLRPFDLGSDLIRLGSQHDGGYLVPDDLQGIKACFSPGVAREAGFEKDLYARGIHSFLADYSVDAAPDGLEHATFVKMFIGAVNNEITIEINNWIETNLDPSENGDLLLQMDIEGDEFGCLLALDLQHLERFRILVLELHSLQNLANPEFCNLAHMTLKKLTAYFDVCHVHPNNWEPMADIAGLKIPKVVEVTMLRKDRTKRRAPIKRMPHSLDRNNHPAQPSIILPDYWWT